MLILININLIKFNKFDMRESHNCVLFGTEGVVTYVYAKKLQFEFCSVVNKGTFGHIRETWPFFCSV